MLDFLALSHQCAPAVDVKTMAALVRVESGFNPYAIGVVRGRLERQPRNLPEAVATVKYLESKGYNYSVGLSQVNRSNFARYGLDAESAFEPCANLTAGSHILAGCFTSARTRFDAGRQGYPQADQHALRAALSCYYSGNYTTGFEQGYVQRVVANATDTGAQPIPLVPAIDRSVDPQQPKQEGVTRLKVQPVRSDDARDGEDKRDPQDAVVF
jgi:type IV secretion system protein VirB1